jgi:hypothetical protein
MIKSINSCVKNEEINSEFPEQENGKKFILKSASNFYCKVIDIDKCCFAKSGLRRCDFLFIVPKNIQPNDQLFTTSKAYYVELKGENIRSACEQLYNAIDRTKADLPNFSLKAKIISTQGFQPSIKTNDYFRRVRKLINNPIDIHKVGKFNANTHTELI